MATVSKFCNKIVAEQKGVRHVLKGLAEKGAGRARADLAQHRESGRSKITVSRGSKIDYFWNLEDPDGGAIGIELGHTEPNGRPVEGLHIIRRSAR